MTQVTSLPAPRDIPGGLARPVPGDPHIWLEDVTGRGPLNWARAHNDRTIGQICTDSEFDQLRKKLLDAFNTEDRIPLPRRRGRYMYNFWRDADHKRGVWRRTWTNDYVRENPNWDVLLDVDALAAAEGENWVWAGAMVLRPNQTRAMVSLSRGGGDAEVCRELDLITGEFVADGFNLPEGKHRLGWIDADTVYVGTDFGPGSMTDSGYPRIAKRWRRGTPLNQAETVFEGLTTDVAVAAGYDETLGYERHFVVRSIDFFNSQTYLIENGALRLIDLPLDADPSIFRNNMLVQLKSDWELPARTYAAGSLLAIDLRRFRTGDRDFTVLFEPTPEVSLHEYRWTENHLLMATLEDVQTKLSVLTPGRKGWSRAELADAPPMATTSIINTDPHEARDEFMLLTNSFIQPSTLVAGRVGGALQPVKQEPPRFDATGLVTEQFFATSDDGTRIPYFITRHPDATGPTLLNGYGGFEVSRTPAYAPGNGLAWLERGGISVSANIRGGGEYGPRWHTQAMKSGRHLVHEDFAAVARDLVARGITTPAQLGAVGGSNGGLLIGVMLTKYPELFGALVCQVPLLDMKRYHLLLAGASWIAEYGDPDKPEEWAYISEYSPYQHVRSDVRYPPTLVTTSTLDDRVHPGHARKMVARLTAEGAPVWYYENTEGGHGGAADNEQAAFVTALIHQFLWAKLAPAE